MSVLIKQSQVWLDRFANLHEALLQQVRESRASSKPLSDAVRQGPGDTIYEIDVHVEPIILAHARKWADSEPLVLIAEGIGQTGKTVLPKSASESDARAVVITDPIDGTRNLMYDKRSAWFLIGLAEKRLPATKLADIQFAMMGELPTSKQTSWDRLWAVRGQGAVGQRTKPDGSNGPLALQPSQATTLEHGFAAVSSFFPGTKVPAALLMERIVADTTGQADTQSPLVFDDQYICSGGQLYELIVGHDRFICDMRSLFYDIQGGPKRHCCHPYDLAAILVAREAGVELTDGMGGPLDGPLNVEQPMNWAGFANRTLRDRIEPVMLDWIDQQRKKRN